MRKKAWARIWIVAVLVVCMVMPVGIASAGEVPAELPRNETLYYLGLQWNAAGSWNPFADIPNNALVFDGQAIRRLTVWESLYMYNPLDGSFNPLLADGDFQWNDEMTELTAKIKPAAKFSDGSPVTANDFAYTWATHIKYQTAFGANQTMYIADVVAVDDATVIRSRLPWMIRARPRIRWKC